MKIILAASPKTPHHGDNHRRVLGTLAGDLLSLRPMSDVERNAR
jgi:hypothetical protein